MCATLPRNLRTLLFADQQRCNVRDTMSRMDVNQRLNLSDQEFQLIKDIAEAAGVRYVGVAGGTSNPHHKFLYPGHSAPWLFEIDSM